MSDNEKNTMEKLEEAYNNFAERLNTLSKRNPYSKESVDVETQLVEILTSLEKLTCLGAASVHWMRRSNEDEGDCICDACKAEAEENKVEA